MTSSSDRNPRPAVLNLPAGDLNGQKQVISCMFHGLENKRLTIETQQKLRVSTAASVECSDTLFLGEVMQCVQTANGSWRSELKVEQVLTELMSLVNLRERLLGIAGKRQSLYSQFAVYA